jgi:hypothetical protein
MLGEAGVTTTHVAGTLFLNENQGGTGTTSPVWSPTTLSPGAWLVKWRNQYLYPTFGSISNLSVTGK